MPASKPPTMTTPVLSTIYLDNQRVGLMGDPRPIVAKVVAAGGHAPDDVQVIRRRSPDSAGTPVRLDDVIDRTADPTKAIYLTCRPKATSPVAKDPLSPVVVPMPDTSPPALRGPLPAQPAPLPTQQDPDGVDPVKGDPEWRV